jgi:minor histocompatibility antigen H13
MGKELPEPYELSLHPTPKGEGKRAPVQAEAFFAVRFGPHQLALLAVSLALYAVYATTKHWLLSNLYAEAFCIFAITSLVLDSFATGIALLSGLFFYDVFWVFGTDVMVTVAKGFDGPIKVLFPRNVLALLASGNVLQSKGVPMAMLGLGDIVLPGVFVALCLRFDLHKGLPLVYFKRCAVAYVAGLMTTMGVMHVFKAAQVGGTGAWRLPWPWPLLLLALLLMFGDGSR